MEQEQFNQQLFGILSKKNITLSQLNEIDEQNIKNNISEIINVENLEIILTGYINTSPFIIYKKNEDIIIYANKTVTIYDINNQKVKTIIKIPNKNTVTQYQQNSLKIKNKNNNITLIQEEKMLEEQGSRFNYHTIKIYQASSENYNMTLTCNMGWEHKPTPQEKPAIIMGSITINNEQKSFAFSLQNGNYITSQKTIIKSYEELQQLLQQNGKMTLQHSPHFTDLISNEIIIPAFITAIEQLVKNNIQINENTMNVNGHQFKLHYPN